MCSRKCYNIKKEKRKFINFVFLKNIGNLYPKKEKVPRVRVQEVKVQEVKVLEVRVQEVRAHVGRVREIRH